MRVLHRGQQFVQAVMGVKHPLSTELTVCIISIFISLFFFCKGASTAVFCMFELCHTYGLSPSIDTSVFVRRHGC